MSQNPSFIAVEGGEGAGKSTLLKNLKSQFNDRIVVTRDPGGSPYAEVIREMALKHKLASGACAEAMLCLMFASRFEHLRKPVIPALEAGKHVITDRSSASSYAYQVQGQDNALLEKLFWNLHSSLPHVPSKYIYLDVEPERGLHRVRERHKNAGESNHFDAMDIDFHIKLRTGYNNFFKIITSVIRIDANLHLEEVESAFRILMVNFGIIT